VLKLLCIGTRAQAVEPMDVVESMDVVETEGKVQFLPLPIPTPD
jgi:hypothetical protein